MAKINLFVCMGSACHQKGVYHLRIALEKLLADHHLETQVELKGAFCLGPCMNSIVMKVDEQLILNVTPENVEQKFADEILPLLVRVNG
ncbi:MAG TPA: NAD(P)H-dependent oxidoreductase subunit E [Phototrophicaceae bacterium]|nr:NAD(P)H-dependent oxidoreductase subunit E [Phototrophicaceae bacterium]